MGADRIAANGDVANKTGTYSLAREHGTKVMVVAPTSTVDIDCASGADIPIEKRPGDEIWRATGLSEAPRGIGFENPAFDVTPAKYIDAIVTENGIVERPDSERMAAMMTGSAGVAPA